MSSFIRELAPRRIDVAAAIEFMAAPENAEAIALFEYWDGKRGARPMPDRNEISPSEIAKLLPWIGIIEVIASGRDFRFRVFGSGLAEWTGRDRSGELFSELEPVPGSGQTTDALRKRWFDVAGLALAAAKPIFVRAPIHGTITEVRTLHGVILPLTAGHAEVGQLLGGGFIEKTPIGD